MNSSRNDRAVAFAVTIDVDAESGPLGSLGIDTPSALSRGTYGITEGMPRLLALLARLGLPATFFVPGYTADLHPDSIRAAVAAGHELGHHGYLHERTPDLTATEERDMLERGCETLERVAGVLPRGYRSPAWEMSPNTLSLLPEYGIDYDASLLGADRPYWACEPTGDQGIVEIPGAWELCDTALFMFGQPPHYRTGLASPSRVLEIWRGDFDGMHAERSDAAFVLTLHPEVIGRHHRMSMLEQFLREVLELDGVWFARMGELADDFRERRAGSDPLAQSSATSER